jgi:D-proline reductase (dithiol) PrdB
MEIGENAIDGFRFLPPSLAAWIRTRIPQEEFQGPIPWTHVTTPLDQVVVGLVTSAGISMKKDPPFDMERERREPTWGDRSFRAIPKHATEEEIDVNHLHIDTRYIKQDINVMLPLARMSELEEERVIGRVAETAYSFYGFQWQSTEFLHEAIEPIARRMKGEGVTAVILFPA